MPGLTPGLATPIGLEDPGGVFTSLGVFLVGVIWISIHVGLMFAIAKTRRGPASKPAAPVHHSEPHSQPPPDF